ncbi:MAG TPA: hypothetical protein VG992_00055 [Candidatus Saccharimonadales bacterium]|nr:hypothetical protein [Candidatus Saccharimonadales bacterium]
MSLVLPKQKLVMKKSAKRPAPKKLRAIQTSRHLRVVHHRHTGHVLPKRSTSYPTLAMIVLCTGVFLSSWTRWATADPTYGPASDSYTVHVRVPGPPPTIAATIDTTNNQTVMPDLTVKALPLSLKGSCALNTYETLYRNSTFSGVAMCEPPGTYHLDTALFPGVNRLQVQTFSLTDVPGPLSDPINVTYTPPAPPHHSGGGGSSGSSGGGASSGGSPVAEPLLLKSTFKFQGYYIGQATPWTVAIEGGTAPYAVAVDWGDGGHALLSRAHAGSLTLDHIYHKHGGYKGTYPVAFSVSDAKGQTSSLQLLAIINNPPPGTGVIKTPTVGSTISGTPDWVRHMLTYIWPSYGLVVLMLTSFWLGERRELRLLKPQTKRSHRR